MEETMDLENDIQKIMLQRVKDEVKPAIGCTEPVAVAYAVATARRHFQGEAESIIVRPSLSVYKNGKSVMVPGTGERGLDMAASLGYVMERLSDPLCIFNGVDAVSIKHAKEVLNDGIISVIPINSKREVFVDVEMKGGEQMVHVILSDHHSHIETVELNGSTVYSDGSQMDERLSRGKIKELTFSKIIKMAEQAELADIEFLLEGVEMNRSAAAQGLKKDNGFCLGRGLLRLEMQGNLSSNPSLRARILTAAGADFRMGGGNLPIMTSGGSGNQGLGVILPIAEVAEYINASEESLSRALYLGHMINIFVKEYTGKLSAICGCAVASGIGASAAIAWLLDGNEEQIEGAVKNMLSGLTGMICDGAKESCSIKLSASAGEAVISAYLAMDGIVVPAESGIVNSSVESTIRNIGTLCEKGMADTNEVLVSIINNN
jgi:L-cysteine desulfidase